MSAPVPTTRKVPESEDARAKVLDALGQLTLGIAGDPDVDATFSGVSRTMLDEHSWVDVVPGWISESHVLFEEIAHAAPWQQHWRRMYKQVFQEPRFTAGFDSIADAPVPLVWRIADALQAHYGVRFDSVWMNFYRDQSNGTGWHADRPANKPPEAIVPLVSLGATRHFLIKPRGGGKSVVFVPASGDLLVMGGRAQRDWLHSAPKQTRPSGPRISLNFGSTEQNRRADGHVEAV